MIYLLIILEGLIIIKVFIKRKILPVETILSKQTSKQASTYAPTHARTHARTHAHTHTHTHKYTHTHTHTNTHTHEHTDYTKLDLHNLKRAASRDLRRMTTATRNENVAGF